MQSLRVFLLLIYLLQNEGSSAGNFDDIELEIRAAPDGSLPVDCSRYANDHEIYTSFGFHVNFGSLSNSARETFGRKNSRGHIVYLNVADKKYLPASVFCLPKLQELYVRNTPFQGLPHQLPTTIDHLASSLTHLGIYNTLIPYLPEEIGKLKHLKSLELINIGLRSLPNSIGLLSSLDYLALGDNQLIVLPSTMTKMSSLDTLVLNDNKQLRNIQSLRGQPRLAKLRTDNCPIERIPIHLPRLTHLEMKSNRLTNLNDIQTLGDGTAGAKTFYFYNNSIGSVTSDVQRIRNLETLNLDHNRLHNLPWSIVQAPALKHLSIRSNYFHEADCKAMVFVFNMTHPGLQLNCQRKKYA